jgi:hypothetical protein
MVIMSVRKNSATADRMTQTQNKAEWLSGMGAGVYSASGM